MLGGHVCWMGFHFTYHARHDLTAGHLCSDRSHWGFSALEVRGAGTSCHGEGHSKAIRPCLILALGWGEGSCYEPKPVSLSVTQCGGGKWEPDGGWHSRRVQWVFSPGRLKLAPGALEAGGLWTQPPSRRSWFEKCCKCDIRAYI